MKNICRTFLFLGLVFSQVQTGFGTSNVVGFVKLDIPPNGGFTLAAWNFRASPPAVVEPVTILELFGSNQLRQAIFVPTQGDSIFFWNPQDQMYDQYFQKNDGNYYNPAISIFTPTNGVMIQPGASFFLAGPQPGLHPQAGETNQIVVLGEVSGRAFYNQSLVQGINMLNLPYTAPTIVSNVDWIAQGATPTTGILPFSGGTITGDFMFLFRENRYRLYFLRANVYGTGWASLENIFGPAPDLQIELGEGAFYYAVTNFTWQLQRPYTYPAD